jgi:hypothetical protein
VLLVPDGADDDVLVAGDLEQGVQADLERGGERHEHVEAEGALAGLDAADGGRAQVGACRQVVQGVAQGGADAAQAGACQALDLGSVAHGPTIARSCE